MEKLILLTLGILGIWSCSTQDDSVENENEATLAEFPMDTFPQKWELAAINVGLTGETLAKDDLPWREYITFNSDGTFSKTRERGGETTMSSGKYSIEKTSDIESVMLLHDKESPIIENCSKEIIEILQVVSKESLSGGSIQCDGPGLHYTRVE